MKLDFKGRYDALLRERPFIVADVGARGGPKSDWLPLREHMRVIGFEPEEAEWKRLSSGGRDHYAQTALYGSKEDLLLHITKRPGLSSVYPPNQPFLKYFDAKNTYGYEIMRMDRISADRMDAVLPQDLKSLVDLIKVDVEGCAFEVLKGCEETLRESLVLGLQVEAEFNEKYTGQPLFGRVDTLIRAHGYQLFDMEVCRWKRKAGLKTAGTQGQLIHGDFVYFLDPDVFFRRISGYSAQEKISKIIKFIILSVSYGIFDLAYEIAGSAKELGFLSGDECAFVRGVLQPSQNFLARLPKLKHRASPLDQIIYHFFMALGGVWLERAGFWQPRLKL